MRTPWIVNGKLRVFSRDNGFRLLQMKMQAILIQQILTYVLKDEALMLVSLK